MKLRDYSILWQSELEFMTGLACRAGCIETGGEVYGLQTHGGRPVIMFATPPGPNAIHKFAFFQQDIEYFRKTNSLLLNQFGVQYLGNWHSHHVLALQGPSDGDIRSLRSIASKNRYQRLCQFVLTFERDPAASTYFNGNHNHAGWLGRKLAKYTARNKNASPERGIQIGMPFDPFRKDPSSIGVHSFFYTDAGNTPPGRCSIKVIAGTSPIRRALDEHHTPLGPSRMPAFPIRRILYESVESGPANDKGNGEFPSRLHRQFARLPLCVQNDATVQYGEGFILLFLPTVQGDGDGQIIVIHSQEPPHHVLAVYYSANGNSKGPIDLTEAAVSHGGYTHLSIAYKKAIKSLERILLLEAGNGTIIER